jgi:sucrose-6-phosphate hydrolase SacC (GH32 family)
MKAETTIKLANHRLGRLFLHLKCLVRGGKWSWHLAGLRRELYGARLFLITVLTFNVSLGCVAANPPENYSEPFRPQYHFTPEKNWMNDPNGMVFYKGEYHLFYQYNPFGNKWGHMSWGHAVSPDLVHWKHLPIALAEEDGVMIFSGSAVIDWKNSSGFGKDGQPPMVAIYTGHYTGKPLQNQNIAFSNDHGRTWTKYSGNPVLDIGAKDFRDPNVFWHQPSGRWVMAVSLPTEHKVRFYSSANLKKWSLLSEFGPAGATNGIWECPDLFPLAVGGGGRSSKWVLIVNLNPGGPAGGSGCQYFVGEFDGTNFVLDASHPQNASQSAQSTDIVLADFEGNDYGAWKSSGTAFGSGPAHPVGGDVTGFNGRGLADSYGGNDSDQGTLISPEFKISTKYLSFLIGGGNHPGSVGVNLLVNGKVVRTATGNNSPQLAWKSWDVSEFAGRDAKIEVFDHYSGSDWGHIMVDHFVLGASPTNQEKKPALWLDYGPDFYAAVTWSDIPKSDGRRIVLGWMSNWLYGQDVPTSPWRSAMTVPRRLVLRDTKEGWRVIQSPVSESETLRKNGARKYAGGSFVEAAEWLSQQTGLPAQLDVELSLEAIPGDASFALSVVTGADEQTVLTVDAGQQKLLVDRSRSGDAGFHPNFVKSFECPLQIRNGKCSLRLVLDTSSLELFAQDGESVLTTTFFASSASRQLALTCESNNPARVTGINIFPLESSMKNSCSIVESSEPNAENKKP